ncbi:MAG TPA: DUF4389 domain-containing protein [Acidimicrobiales bacterium]|nr:DUF4389 domain-containing protein [Acidimicrobiales bacterium]
MTTENPAVPPAYQAVEPHPVQLIIPHQAEYSRGLSVLGVIFFIGKIIGALPVLIVLYILNIILHVGAWIMQFAVLFTGKYPEGAHEFFTGIIQLNARALAWILGLNDRYPGFSLK